MTTHQATVRVIPRPWSALTLVLYGIVLILNPPGASPKWIVLWLLVALSAWHVFGAARRTHAADVRLDDRRIVVSRRSQLSWKSIECARKYDRLVVMRCHRYTWEFQFAAEDDVTSFWDRCPQRVRELEVDHVGT